MPVDIDAAVRNALENRTDMVSARKNLERSDYNPQFAKNQLLPQLDLSPTTAASGADGTQIRDAGQSAAGTDPRRLRRRGLDVFGFDFPTWTLGFNVSLRRSPTAAPRPTPRRPGSARTRRSRAYRRLELQVAAEVRTAGRGVDSGFKRVASSQAARRLAAERLDAEEKKFAAGMSTNFLVTQAQRDLAQAEVNELRAIADYRKSVINFQRVQEAGVSGTGAALVLSGGSSERARAAKRILSGAAASSANQF